MKKLLKAAWVCPKVGWGKVSSWQSVVNYGGDSEMAAAFIRMQGRGRAHQRNNGSCQLPCPEERHLSSPRPKPDNSIHHYLFPATFPAAAPALELRASESVSKSVCGLSKRSAWECSHPHLTQPQAPRCSQPEIQGTFLPGSETLGWGTWCGAGTPRSSGWEGPPQLRYLSQYSMVTHRCGTTPFCVSAPPTNLNVASSLCP